MNAPLFIFDSDALVVAHRSHYRNAFASCFWDWIKDGIKQKQFISPIQVKKEIEEGLPTDFLVKEAKSSAFNDFWKPTIPLMIKKYAILQNWANVNWASHQKSMGRKEVNIAKSLEIFADEKKADAWLIALAMSYEEIGRKAYVVSNETSDPKAGIIKIPDAANAHGITTIPIWDCLHKCCSGNFKYTKHS